MNQMRSKKSLKLFALFLIGVLTIGCLYGCGKSDKDKKSGDKVKVVATIFPVYDFLREIGGDRIDLTMLMTPGAETHSYEPTPKDIMKVEESNLFAYVGGDSDEWVEKILEGSKNKKMKIVTLMDCVKTVDEEHVEGMTVEDHNHDHNHDGDEKKDAHKHEHEHDGDSEKHDHDHDGKPEQDEHVWTSPANAIEISKKLTKELSEIDPDNANYYKKNCDTYVKKLETLDKKFMKIAENGKRKEIIFGDRFPFRYFVDRYNLKYYAAFPGCSTDTEASANTIAFLTNKVKEDKIPVVFHIELSNTKIANSIAEATGAKVLQLNAVHNVSKEDFEKGASYLSLMEENLKTLEEALN